MSHDVTVPVVNLGVKVRPAVQQDQEEQEGQGGQEGQEGQEGREPEYASIIQHCFSISSPSKIRDQIYRTSSMQKCQK